MMGRVLCWLIMVVVVVVMGSVRGGEVTYDGRSLIIGGQRKILFSGSIHYPRSPPESTVRFQYLLMPETRSEQSYNSMDQASHHSNPSNTINEPTQTPTTFQQQFDQLSQTLGSILHHLDVIEEHSTTGRGRDGGVEYRAPRQRDGIGDNEDEQEVHLGGG
ncbi:hypothetical protein LWI29_024634 [Acer saccharum]|uniref:Beta-galactosidase n=1 Tax=Acer saccharum TaxID=4024 RepID=A0AA39VE69_ACESA|nr:hypothetical protein LWI29_024634 [Acer saccharum]